MPDSIPLSGPEGIRENSENALYSQYVDDPAFRQAIESQLNKVESSHKFAKAISFGHNHEFIQGEKVGSGDRGRLPAADQECDRLLELSLPFQGAQHAARRRA